MAEIGQRQPGQPQSQIDEAKRQKLLELVRGRAMARPTDLAEDEVMVWPSLVVVEAVSRDGLSAILTFLSIFVSAPLTERANPNQTPNPSKAPWYFLNLQELLLHMDAGSGRRDHSDRCAWSRLPRFRTSTAARSASAFWARRPRVARSSGSRRYSPRSSLIVMILLDEAQGRGTVFGIGTWLGDHGRLGK